MSYTKTAWQTGDVITANKLNNAEVGIENLYKQYGGVYSVNIIEVEDEENENVHSATDKTAAEIIDAMRKMPVKIKMGNTTCYALGCIKDHNDTYTLIAANNGTIFDAENLNEPFVMRGDR